VMLHLARGCVWLTRRILWALMHAGHAISWFMLRKMEYAADSYEAKLAGSDAFEITASRLRVLNVATQIAYEDVRQSWASNRLPENLPLLIDHKLRQREHELTAAAHLWRVASRGRPGGRAGELARGAKRDGASARGGGEAFRRVCRAPATPGWQHLGSYPGESGVPARIEGIWAAGKRHVGWRAGGRRPVSIGRSVGGHFGSPHETGAIHGCIASASDTGAPTRPGERKCFDHGKGTRGGR